MELYVNINMNVNKYVYDYIYIYTYTYIYKGTHSEPTSIRNPRHSSTALGPRKPRLRFFRTVLESDKQNSNKWTIEMEQALT